MNTIRDGAEEMISNEQMIGSRFTMVQILFGNSALRGVRHGAIIDFLSERQSDVWEALCVQATILFL